jgi:drug/metabolite transporter (DMT)-like permease
LCAVLWGGLAVAVRFTQEDLPPFGTAGIRFACASLMLYGWARWRGESLALRPGQFPPCLMLGLLLFLQIGTFHWGLTRTNSAHASVLIGANPVFVAVLAHLLLADDRLSWAKTLGLALALVGLVAVVAGERTASATRDAVTLLGDGVILGSSFLLGVKTTFTKHALAQVEVTKLLVWSNVAGTLMFFAYSGVFEGFATYRFTNQALYGLAYQGLVVAGFCFLAWTYLLRRHRASQLAVFGFFQPVCGMLFGALFRNDQLTASLIFGAAAVGLGVWLVARAD